MHFTKIIIGLSATVGFGFAAPVQVREADIATPHQFYSNNHHLKMAEDDFKKKRDDTPVQMYSNNHHLKMAEDDFKKRADTPAQLYSNNHHLKMAEDDF